MNGAFRFALVLPGLLVTAMAPAQEARKLAVLDLKVEGGADAAVGSQLTARISELLGKRPGLTVMAPDDVRAVLEHESAKQLVGCDDDGCLAEIAGALGADVVVTGRVGKLDDAYALSVTAIDARSARALARVSETWRGDSIALLELAEPVVDKLMSEVPETLAGAIDVSGAIDGSRILIDEQVRGTAPAGQMGGIGIGAHYVTVVTDGYQPFERAVIVKQGQTTALAVQQEVDEPPFYSTWWFWTLAGGGVLAAGATAAVVGLVALGQQEGQTGVNVGVNAETAATGGR